MERNRSVDVLRFFAALAVVYIHAFILVPQGWILAVMRAMVHVFFILTGYFIFTNDNDRLNQRLQKSIRKTFLILVYSSALFFLFNLPLYLRDGFPGVESFVNFLVFNENPYGFHLWYLGAVLYSLIILLVCFKGGIGHLSIKIFPFLAIVGVIISEFFAENILTIIPHNFAIRNFLFEGLPLVSIGMLLHENSGKFGNARYLPLYALFFLALLFFENQWVEENNADNLFKSLDIYFGSILLSITLTIWTIKEKRIGELCPHLAKWGEQYGLFIYVVHPIPLILLRSVIKRTSIQEIPPFFEWLICAIITVSFAKIFYHYIRKKEQ